MATKKSLPPLSLDNIPKNYLDRILRYLVLQEIRKDRSPERFQSLQPNRFLLFQYYKNFRLVSRLKGSALCLLKTQFAKKPKNPV